MPDAALTRPFPEPVALLRYLDVVLVIAALPFVAFAGLPLLGYAVGGAAWIAQRAAGAVLERRAKRTTDVRRQVGLNLGGSLARAWIVGGAILAVGLAGEREDGLTAAVLVAVAFTVYFAVSVLLHTTARGSRVSKTRKILLGVFGVYLLAIVLVVVIFGFKRQDNKEFQPQNEFQLDTWVDLPGPLDFNKGVLYVIIAGILTVVSMVYIANRMQDRPNRVQTAVETIFAFVRDDITGGSMDDKMARKWFPFLCTLFLFIWFSNLIGYIPLPTNSAEKIDIAGLEIPAFAIYAATANISIPLVLALVVFVSFNVEGIRAKGFIGYMKSLIPEGVGGAGAVPLFVLELVSNFMRLLSLSVRLFANILAGHLIILFMSGGLAVLLGLEVLGVFTLPAGVILFLFELGLVATLQAFIFAMLSAIYLGGAVAEAPLVKGDPRAVCPFFSRSSRRPTMALTRAGRSPSAWVAASAPSAPASASASSSAR